MVVRQRTISCGCRSVRLRTMSHGRRIIRQQTMSIGRLSLRQWTMVIKRHRASSGGVIENILLCYINRNHMYPHISSNVSSLRYCMHPGREFGKLLDDWLYIVTV